MHGNGSKFIMMSFTFYCNRAYGELFLIFVDTFLNDIIVLTAD